MAYSPQHFLAETENFPHTPGVYIMRDSEGGPLYIGKAVDLRSRVRSYFSDDHDDRPYIPIMLRRLHAVEWIATNTEAEALILEANLVRTHKPPYNIELRDDKHFPYLKITVGEPFPRLLVVRRVESDGATYLGPYTDAGAMRRNMAFALRLFRIRDCNKRLPLSRAARPCINYSMGRCSGACAGLIGQDEYRHNVDMMIRFLRGRRRDLLAELTRAMADASAHMRFEQAAALRDQIQLVKDASGPQRVDLRLPDVDCDVVGIAEADRRLCLAVLSFREGLLSSKRHFVIKKETWDCSESDHESAILQFYREGATDVPSELLLPSHGGFNAGIMTDWFRSQLNATVEVSIPQKGAKAHIVEMAIKNARLYLAEKAPVDPMADVEELQKALSLPRPPLVIEAFDISNLGPDYTVAGMVQFKEGEPNKSQYRTYKIKGVEGQNDFAMMMEVVTRRLTRLTEEGKPFPDLLLIDGGKGQLHAAMAALAHFEHAPLVASIAKQEELLYTPTLSEPVRLPANHPARKLAERIRDEVHRFSITFHRKVRGKKMRTSVLQDIAGVGPARSRALLRHFGSLQNVMAAPVDDIAQVKGFSREAAEALKSELLGK
jgi:excinuclease ABC subunit C